MPVASPTPAATATVLALHHGYRVAGGEERAAAQLAALAEAELGERVTWLGRDSTAMGARAAARGLLTGGSDPEQVRRAVAESGADLVHAHNLFPTFGPAALEAARDAGAAVAVHLHNYRLVCAVATTVRNGRDCTECHAGRPLPGVRHRCRGGLPEVVAYAAALPRWQRRVMELADVVIVPSGAAQARLEQLGVALPEGRVHVVGGVAGEITTTSTASTGTYALAVTRLAPEKELRTAIEACALVGLPLVIAGDGPERSELEAHARTVGAETTFVGRVDDATLADLRAGARVGLATSVAHETFGLSALESMSAALPTVGSAVGALPELLGPELVAPPRDPAALATLIRAVEGSDEAGQAAAARAQRLAAPKVVAAHLAGAYAAAREHAGGGR